MFGLLRRRLPKGLVPAMALIVFMTAGSTNAQPPAAPSASEPDWQSLYRPHVFAGADGGQLPYRILEPPTIEPGKKYPLVLFLHGAGERGDDNRSQLKHGAADFARKDRREANPAFVVFPQCPNDFRWVESDWGLPTGQGAMPREPSVTMALVRQLLDELLKNPAVDRDRVYVTGLSMGGQGSWFAAATWPETFAAMLEVCGGSDPGWAVRYDGVPIWAFHGQKDTVVPISRGREMIKALAEAGHHPELRYVEYPGVGHDSWSQTYRRDDVYEWLFKQHK